MQQTAARPSILNNQKGFTLIELIVVIVILGIMSAVAIPKFSDIQTEARIAKMQGALGAMKGASGVAHGTWLAKGDATSTSITMEGISVVLVNGYPSNAGIVVASGGLTDYVTTTAGTVSVDSTRTTCKIVYTEATATAPPVFDASGLNATVCK